MGKTRILAQTALMVALMCVCAWISIPFGAQPFTMQTFAVFVAAALLGAKGGLIVVMIYILLGCAGLPVFSAMQGGLGIVLGNTGGYMLGFVFIALIVGIAAQKFSGTWALILSMVLGTAVCYAFGTAWYMALYTSHGAGTLASVLLTCVVPFIIPDVLKMLLAVTVVKRIKKLI